MSLMSHKTSGRKNQSTNLKSTSVNLARINCDIIAYEETKKN